MKSQPAGPGWVFCHKPLGSSRSGEPNRTEKLSGGGGLGVRAHFRRKGRSCCWLAAAGGGAGGGGAGGGGAELAELAELLSKNNNCGWDFLETAVRENAARGLGF